MKETCFRTSFIDCRRNARFHARPGVLDVRVSGVFLSAGILLVSCISEGFGIWHLDTRF